MSDISFIVENDLKNYADLFREYCPHPLSVKKGTDLTKQCSVGGWLYYVLDGILKTYTTNSNSNQRIIDLMHAHTIVGMDCLDPNAKSIVSIACITDVIVLPFTPNILRRMIIDHPEFGFDMVCYYGRILRQVTYHSAVLAVGSRETRLANFLYLYTDTDYYKRTQEIRLSQEDLAASCGTSLSQVARTLRKLREQGIITTSNKRITIKDTEALKACCSF